MFDKVKAFSLGAVDYVTKPFQMEEVLARVKIHLDLQKTRRDLQAKNFRLQQAKESVELTNAALSAINEVSFAVNQSLDLEEALEGALQIVLQELNLEYGWVLLPEDSGRLLRLVTSVGLPDEFRRQEVLTPANSCFCGRVLAAGELGGCFSTNNCTRVTPYRQQYPALKSSHITQPAVARQEFVALLNLGGANIEHLTAKQFRWLAMIGQQIGNAVENLRLYQNALNKTQRLTVLNRVSTIVSTSWQLDEVLPPLLREMARTLEMSLGLLLLRAPDDEDRYQIRARFGHWHSGSALDDIAWHKLAHLAVIERTQVPLLIPVAGQDERMDSLAALIDQEKIQTVLTLPLVVQNQISGFIQLHSVDRERIFGEAEVELARTLTNHAAVALEKARLYEATVARYEQDLEIARQIQQNLLPRTVPNIPGLKLAGVCHPAYETGGDFFDYVLLPNQRLGVVVGDVTGKSLPAAMVMALARNTIRSELVNNPRPAEAMTTANGWLCRDIRPGTFVAAVQALFDPVEQRMWLVSAGQTAAILIRAGQTNYLLPDGAVALPLGIQPGTIYGQAEIPLQPGDTLLFYTDGLVEARSETGEMFGFERLEATLRQFDHNDDPARLIEDLLAELRLFVGQAEQHDDITLVAVRLAALNQRS
jgi:serine phosphatase RsbU (regulator of sigma subunit)